LAKQQEKELQRLKSKKSKKAHERDLRQLAECRRRAEALEKEVQELRLWRSIDDRSKRLDRRHAKFRRFPRGAQGRYYNGPADFQECSPVLHEPMHCNPASRMRDPATARISHPEPIPSPAAPITPIALNPSQARMTEYYRSWTGGRLSNPPMDEAPRWTVATPAAGNPSFMGAAPLFIIDDGLDELAPKQLSPVAPDKHVYDEIALGPSPSSSPPRTASPPSLPLPLSFPEQPVEDEQVCV